MPFTNFPNGVTSFGIPQLGSNIVSIPNLAGTVFFVDPVNGSDGNDGSSPSSPFKTINHCLTQVKTASGTTIFLYPGTYLENVVVTALNNVSFVAAYIQSSGASGVNKPAIAPTTGIPLTLNQCTGLYFRGVKIVSTAAATVAVLTDSKGCIFQSCHIQATGVGIKIFGTTTVGFDGSGMICSDCQFDGCTHGIEQFASVSPVVTQATNCKIMGCVFANNSSSDIADDATATVFWSLWDIIGNFFTTKSKSVYLAMSGNGSQTTTFCNIAGNYFGATATMTTTMIALEAGSMFMGNFNTIGVVDGHTF